MNSNIKPINVYVAIDISASMIGKIDKLIYTLKHDFLSEFNDNDYVIYLYTFNNNDYNYITSGPPSSINFTEFTPSGGTPLYDTIVALINSYPKPYILIIISDGEDTTSKCLLSDVNMIIGNTKVYYIGYMTNHSLKHISNDIGAVYGNINDELQIPELMRNLSETVRAFSENNIDLSQDFETQFGDMTIDTQFKDMTVETTNDILPIPLLVRTANI
jgi:hypothetical protein